MSHKYVLLLLLMGGMISTLYGKVPNLPLDSTKDNSFFTWRDYGWYKWSGHDSYSNNYFDPTLVFVDDSDFVHVKAYRKLLPHNSAEYHAGGFRSASAIGKIGTFKFVFTIPNFTTHGDSIISYSTDATGGPVLYTLRPNKYYDTIYTEVPPPTGKGIGFPTDTIIYTIQPTYEYDIPEIYGAITDTFGHFNFYKDSIVTEQHSYGNYDTTYTLRAWTFHNTYNWDFSDMENRGNGLTTAWLSIFEDSAIFSVERQVIWENSVFKYIHHIEHSVVISGDTFQDHFKPDANLYAEFLLWWVRHTSSVPDPESWQGPDTLEMVVRDFLYSPTPTDPRKGDYTIRIPIDPRNTATNNQHKIHDSYNTNTILYTVSRPEKVYLKIFDMTGRILKEKSLGVKSPGQYLAKFNQTNLPNGIYFVVISGKSILAKHKFIAIH